MLNYKFLLIPEIKLLKSIREINQENSICIYYEIHIHEMFNKKRYKYIYIDSSNYMYSHIIYIFYDIDYSNTNDNPLS